MRTIVIAGTTSGVGKTTIAIGLMGILASHGLKVQPFKTGPDYIDSSYHTMVTGRPSRNLDTWMLPHEAVIELFNRATAGKDIAVVEGVMGLYDGRSSTNEEGSTAELAKLLKAPVILVLDSRKGARSMAAMAHGYQDFDRDINVAGVILNGIGSIAHFEICREAIEHYTKLKVVGYLPRKEDLSMPERYLGLIPTAEGATEKKLFKKIIARCQETFDIDKILKISEEAKTPHIESRLFPRTPIPSKVKIAVAMDKAFSFYYRDSLDLLEAWGAKIIPFSPLEDTSLPRNISGLYIGGGFPELFAADLANNKSLKKAIKIAARQGMPVNAECGGLMYLGKSIRDADGREHPMVGAIPVSSRIDGPHLSLGYRTIQALADGPILREGEIIRGHEFHWSVLKGKTSGASAYRILDKGERQEGFQNNNLVASYIHLHLGSLPHIASRFVEICRQFQNSHRQRGVA
jgi:cobyrinic acid a,c-diamide synthase